MELTAHIFFIICPLLFLAGLIDAMEEVAARSRSLLISSQGSHHIPQLQRTSCPAHLERHLPPIVLREHIC